VAQQVGDEVGPSGRVELRLLERRVAHPAAEERRPAGPGSGADAVGQDQGVEAVGVADGHHGGDDPRVRVAQDQGAPQAQGSEQRGGPIGPLGEAPGPRHPRGGARAGQLRGGHAEMGREALDRPAIARDPQECAREEEQRRPVAELGDPYSPPVHEQVLLGQAGGAGGGGG
jgi:hypothetical protein